MNTQNRYKKVSSKQNKNSHCIYGWTLFRDPRAIHKLHLDGLLNLNGNIKKLKIEDFSCDPHKISLRDEFISTPYGQATPNKVGNFIRASNFCKLENLKNLIPYAGYSEKDLNKLEWTIKYIIESKFTPKERSGNFS